jgi:putative endonuclease
MWYIYILKCSDGTLYTGSTNDLKKRVQTHNEGKAAAKYTRARRPVKMVYSEKFGTKSEALKREWVIKKMSREEKINLLNLKE